jgi:hypothetical protein
MAEYGIDLQLLRQQGNGFELGALGQPAGHDLFFQLIHELAVNRYATVFVYRNNHNRGSITILL